MAIYPSIGTIQIEKLSMENKFNNLKSEFGLTGIRKVRRKSLFQKRDIRVKHTDITQAEIRELLDFYNARYGSYESFYFSTNFSDTYVSEYVGTGDGATLIYNLPSINASATTVYVDGVAWNSGSDYTFSAAGGSDGVDLITFIATPNDGLYITYEFTGPLVIRCHFEKDLVKYSYFNNIFADISSDLEGELYS